MMLAAASETGALKVGRPAWLDAHGSRGLAVVHSCGAGERGGLVAVRSASGPRAHPFQQRARILQGSSRRARTLASPAPLRDARGDSPMGRTGGAPPSR